MKTGITVDFIFWGFTNRKQASACVLKNVNKIQEKQLRRSFFFFKLKTKINLF